MKKNKHTSWNAYNTGETNKRKVYNFVCEFIKAKGYAPSLKEICNGVDLSIAAVYKHLTSLIDDGELETDWTRPARRNIQIPQKAV